MKWIGITGTWRLTTPEIERDVRRSVSKIFEQGNGIVSGGALGVDYMALDEALKYDLEAERIKIIIPVALSVFAELFRERASNKIVTEKQAREVIKILEDLKSRNPNALEEMNFEVCEVASHRARNIRVVKESDELLAFQVNGSLGVQHTMDNAEKAGKTVYLRKYNVVIPAPNFIPVAPAMTLTR